MACYRKTDRQGEAATYIAKARELMKNEDDYNRACFESACGNVEAALALLQAALEKNPTMRDWARHDPDFDFIRDDPRFAALGGDG